VAYDPDVAARDEAGWVGAKPKPYADLSEFERRCLRRDAFDLALAGIERRGGDPETLKPVFVAAFDPERWPAIVRWLHRVAPQAPDAL
jgi:hypothetical protein